MLVRERLDVMERERKKLVIYKSVTKGWGNFNLMGYSNIVMEKNYWNKGSFWTSMYINGWQAGELFFVLCQQAIILPAYFDSPLQNLHSDLCFPD